MPNLTEQLRRYGAYLDGLEAPARATRAASGWTPGLAPRRPRLVVALASVAGLVVLCGVVVGLAGSDGPGPVQAVRTEDATTGGAAPAVAAPGDRSLSAEGSATTPDVSTRASTGQHLRDGLGSCPGVARAKDVVRRVTATDLGAASVVRVDPDSAGPCVRLARVDWDRGIVHLERVPRPASER